MMASSTPVTVANLVENWVRENVMEVGLTVPSPGSLEPNVTVTSLLGAAANLIRYLFVRVDPTVPVQQMLRWLVGLDLNRLLMASYQTLVVPVFDHFGTDSLFVPIFSGSGRTGFGPFALLLVLPAMIHALVWGPRRLKVVIVAWAGYLYLAALVVAWHAGGVALLTPLYAANGFVVAFSLPPWRLRRRGMRILQLAFALLMAWSLFGRRCM